jgi:hypothetical protein
VELHGANVHRVLESRSGRCIALGGRFLLPFPDIDDVEDIGISAAGEFSQLGRRWKLYV